MTVYNCSNCRALVGEGNAFCSGCGAAMQWTAEAPVPVGDPARYQGGGTATATQRPITTQMPPVAPPPFAPTSPLPDELQPEVLDVNVVWRRVFADIMDLALVYTAIWLLVPNTIWPPFWEATTAWTFLAETAVFWIYTASMQASSWQATIGMKALDIIVIDDQHRGRITFANASGRYAASLLSALILYIGYVMIFFNDERKTLHDKLAGTLVVRKR